MQRAQVGCGWEPEATGGQAGRRRVVGTETRIEFVSDWLWRRMTERMRLNLKTWRHGWLGVP